MPNKVYRSVNEMISDNKDEIKEALKELNKSTIERRKEKKQKLSTFRNQPHNFLIFTSATKVEILLP